jgi:hypothetical protein
VTKLWDSWEDDARIGDKETGRFTEGTTLREHYGLARPANQYARRVGRGGGLSMALATAGTRLRCNAEVAA